MKLVALLLFFLGCATNGIPLPSIHPGDAGYRLIGDIVSQSDEVAEYIHRQEARGAAATIEINSDGGNAYEGLAIYRVILGSKVPVVCLVNGHAASAAFLILEACSSRRMTHTSLLATHRPLVVIPEPATLTVEALQSMAMRAGRLTALWDALIARRLDMDPTDYAKKVTDGDVWVMNADQAIEANAIDVVVDATPVPNLGPSD